MPPIGNNGVRSCGSKVIPCTKRLAQQATANIRGVVAQCPVRAQEINAGPPGGCYARRVGRPDPLSQLQNKPLNRASAAPGSDCVEAAPLAGSARLDGQNRAAAPDADPVATHRAVDPAAQTAAPPAVLQPETAAASGGSRFLRACLRLPTDRTPVWFLRQAGRYMPEYRAVRRHHTLLDICRTPALAAEVTITAAEASMSHGAGAGMTAFEFDVR